MAYPRWRGTSSRARRRRIERIFWTRRQQVSVFLLCILILVTVALGLVARVSMLRLAS